MSQEREERPTIRAGTASHAPVYCSLTVAMFRTFR